MTNTKFRKRALLSSVAMLLVALVALGSATFAWFTSSTTARAEGLAISTTKSSELKVAKVDLQWADTVEYNDEAGSYVPTSSTTGNTWYTANAQAKTAYTADSTTYAAASNLDGVVYKEMLNIKNAGGKTATGVKINVAGTFASAFGRIAIVPVADQTTANTFPSLTAADFKSHIYGSAATDSWKPYNGSGVESTAWSLAGAASGLEITVGDLEANEVASYMILVWFEGEDEDCYDLTNSALTIGSATALSFTVSTT